MEKKTILPVKVEGIVNGGAIAMVEGLRGFIPASKLSLSYIEDLEAYLLNRYFISNFKYILWIFDALLAYLGYVYQTGKSVA